jgi:hypothetical protein
VSGFNLQEGAFWQIPLSDFLKENPNLNIASTKTPYEVPIEHYNLIEKKQVIESFYEKKAQSHLKDNQRKLMGLFDKETI